MLSVTNSKLQVHLAGNDDVFRAELGSSSAHRILIISVNPVLEPPPYSGNDSSSPVIGYLLACTLYSVHWFIVKHSSTFNRPVVLHAGGKVFKSCSVVHACWSPHILEQSVVLLGSGQLFLFDLESYCHGSSTAFRGTRLKVSWNDSGYCSDSVWVSCEFSWHPRILVVARSDAVFLVDLRSKECNVSCLMKIDMLRMYAPSEKEQFLALAKAGPNHFFCAVASSSLLLLIDARKPMMPVLQWMHNIDDPCYITVLSLSTLRSHSREDTFKLASEYGYCIILGSFWNCEFSLFCYGPELPFQNGYLASKLSKINKAFCAWELPSEIDLSGCKCHCGDCLLTEELSKDALPEWIDWQLKKEIVLGFGILSNELAALLCEPDENGGFTLIRLLSSGKFELQRYHASRGPARNLDYCQKQELYLDKHLHPFSEEEYKFPKRFHYLKLAYLQAYPQLVNKHKIALDFLALPDLPQLPPFFLRKSSCHSNDDIVGPVRPFPFLLVLNEFYNGCSSLEDDEFSVEAELGLKYNEVMKVASDITVSTHGSMDLNDDAVSLSHDQEEAWDGSLKRKSFLSYRPIAFSCSAKDFVTGNSVYSDGIYDTFMFQVRKPGEQTKPHGGEVFDDQCPVELRLNASLEISEPQGLEACNLLKKHMSKWEQHFDLYKEFCINLDLK
ncbi:hypothetical protein Ahy_B02g060317 isoform A [Arachis hypogaea]|uniref:Uncharacterized protein n=1 Tax=Arachis hypogaea TaxID=3818 RepID=A0A445AIA0_ARAHY|nr:hypothetical protein Ahy_B02g060317 isoform A [Arachis hypogaea]